MWRSSEGKEEQGMQGGRSRQDTAGGYYPVPGWEGPLPKPDARSVDELRQVLASPECPCAGVAYLMYRGVARSEEERRWMHAEGIRFDITVIPARLICGEYIKTKGHHHPENEAGTGYPELYEVIAGEAHYLLQDRELRDVCCIRAVRGEKVLIPPGYGHVTINPSPFRTLVMANLVSERFESDYAPYERMHGAAYYEMIGNQFLRNPHCRSAPVLRCSPPMRDGTLGIRSGVPLYRLVESRSDLSFLNHPERFAGEFRGP